MVYLLPPPAVIYNNFPMEKDFYKTVPLLQMTNEQWEALCDGCGKCCFRKFIDGHGKNTKLYFTRIACNQLDLCTGRCSNYKNRFKFNKECTHLTKNNVSDFSWLPETCAYRLLWEQKTLPEWHPLVCGIPMDKNPAAKEVFIKNPVHEKDVENWEDYILSEEPINEK